MRRNLMNPREHLVHHIQALERLEELKAQAAQDLKDGLAHAAAAGYDITTLKVVLRLRKMTPGQRRERRALEAIYLAALGMLEGEALPDAARRRLDEQAPADPPAPPPSPDDVAGTEQPAQPEAPAAPEPQQPPLIVKDPAEAKQEGADAAAAGKRIYDNPYPAGDPCRAAWDEGWCAQQKSHGMETPAAYQRRTGKSKKADKDDKPDGGDAGDEKKGAA